MTNVGKDVEALQLVDSAQPLVRAANYPPLEARDVGPEGPLDPVARKSGGRHRARRA